MLLKRERETGVVLYDDHGEAWKITLDSAGDGAMAGEGDPAEAPGPRAIRFLGPEGEPLRVLYEGAAAGEEELELDDVVVHFLRAQD